jgi:hypothetical protein
MNKLNSEGTRGNLIYISNSPQSPQSVGFGVSYVRRDNELIYEGDTAFATLAKSSPSGKIEANCKSESLQYNSIPEPLPHLFSDTLSP